MKTAPTRSLRRKLPPEVIDEIVSRYLSGEFTTDLSCEYGISKSGLLKLLRAEGVSIRKRSITSEDTDRVVQLYEGGMSITEIVEQIGYSYSTVRKSLHHSGVVVRLKGIKRSSI